MSIRATSGCKRTRAELGRGRRSLAEVLSNFVNGAFMLIPMAFGSYAICIAGFNNSRKRKSTQRLMVHSAQACWREASARDGMVFECLGTDERT